MTPTREPRESTSPAWQWGLLADGVEIRFLGRDVGSPTGELLGRIRPRPGALARLVQIHSDRVLEAAPGVVGQGDALVTSKRDLALAVATADCVPILLASPGWIAAVHAGWRGLAAGVVSRTLERIEQPTRVEAWIGPAIGPCCYEVSAEVAARVAAASSSDILSPGTRGRPHIDLRLAATEQLSAAGVERVHQIELCTRCNVEALWSYRRDGSRAGRNWAVIWRAGAA